MQQPMIAFAREHPRCSIWASPGSGKTSAMLLLIDILALEGSLPGPTLVCGPVRVVRDVWPNEAAKWEQTRHLRVIWIGGTPYERERILRERPMADVYSCSYELLPWLVNFYTDRWPFRQVIADEADRLKGFRLKQGTMRAHSLARVAHTLVARWVNLSGSPAPNGLKDLWGPQWMVDRGQRLGFTHGAFMERFFRVNPYTRAVEAMPYSDAQIHAALVDSALTLDAKDYFNLHEPKTTTIEVTLPPDARRIYRELEKELFAELVSGTEIEVFNAASLTNKIVQLCNSMRLRV
jgi:SNF2 family DNA or RNA helicase